MKQKEPIKKNAQQLLKTVEFLQQSNAIERVYDEDSLKKAIGAWEYLLNFAKITPVIIKKTHEILMAEQPLREGEKGRFRKEAVFIGNKEGIPWPLIPSAMEQWCDVVNANVQAKIGDSYKFLHVSYEKIHPFVDGNGRTGRMFMNWQRLKSGLPILIIHEGVEQLEYYQWFA